jgi:hypothetical protein
MIGKVISDLARHALDTPLVISDLPLRNGIRVLPRRGGEPITNEMVQELLEPKFCPKLASGQKTTAGKVISDLVRKALTQPSSEQAT